MRLDGDKIRGGIGTMDEAKDRCRAYIAWIKISNLPPRGRIWYDNLGWHMPTDCKVRQFGFKGKSGHLIGMWDGLSESGRSILQPMQYFLTHD